VIDERNLKDGWNKVSAIVGTRTPKQCRTHAKRYFDAVVRKAELKITGAAKEKRGTLQCACVICSGAWR
jgi:hypothetical protein